MRFGLCITCEGSVYVYALFLFQALAILCMTSQTREDNEVSVDL